MERENARHRSRSEALWDDLVAADIISRLPTKCAARSPGASAACSRPRISGSTAAACFIGFRENPHGDGASGQRRVPYQKRRRHHALHFVAGVGALSVKHGVGLPFRRCYRYGGTCNGLVLLAAVTDSWSWQPGSSRRLFDAVIVNPATKEEEAFRVSLPAAVPADTPWPWRPVHLCGFWYGPASKAYKALIVERQDDVVRFTVASFGRGGGGGGQEPVATSVKLIKFSGYDMDLRCQGSLAMDGGMVYVLISTASVPVVLAFSVKTSSGATTQRSYLRQAFSSLHFRSDDPRQPECAGVLRREYLEVFVEMMQKLPDSMEDVKQELFMSSL